MKISVALLALIMSVTGFAMDPRMELNDVKCAYWDDVNDDARLGIEFSYLEENNDFAVVTISKRMTDSDESWKVISKTSEQVASGQHQFSLGIDEISIVINRPIPGWNKAKKNNGYLEYVLSGKTYNLRCENIKK